MRTNTTLTKLRNGHPAIGTWLQLHHLHATRLLAAQGCFDWMLVDFEHTPVDLSVAAHLFSTISDITQGRVTPLARVATGTIEQIKWALDCGAQGIVVPMVNTPQEAADAVRFARFPPQGERGGGGLAPHLGFGIDRPQYMQKANEQILVGIQIETKQAVANIEAILDVPGIDLIFIGPNDLHMSLGLPARFWSDAPDFLAAVERVVTGCHRRNIAYGTLCREARVVKERIAEGFTLLGMGSDVHFMLTFAGMQYGELHNLAEPQETWCNRVALDPMA